MLFLGTGFSSGVPEGNCACEVCEKARDMSSPFFRTRSSVLIEHDGKNILIDAGTDFRFQTIKHNVRKIDAVLITHAHEDHIGGIPDLRGFSSTWGNDPALSMYCRQQEINALKRRFGYIFDENVTSTKPKFGVKTIEPGKPFDVFGLTVTPMLVSHPPEDAFGFRINDLAYIPDAKTIPSESMKLLQGIKTLVILGNSDESYPKQMSIFEAAEIAKTLKAERVFFTHIGHRVQRNKADQTLPPHMKLAFDGLKIDF